MKSVFDSVYLIKPERYYDDRGYFSEVFNFELYSEMGIEDAFVQDNHSFSKKPGTLRGLHFQSPPHAQSKLVSCCHGKIFDVIIDIRIGSPTYAKWEGYTLSAENGFQLYVPKGFAHGFVTLEPDSELFYKCSDYYAPVKEGALRWDSCGIDWPFFGDPVLSEKDANAPALADLDSPFIFGQNS